MSAPDRIFSLIFTIGAGVITGLCIIMCLILVGFLHDPIVVSRKCPPATHIRNQPGLVTYTCIPD